MIASLQGCAPASMVTEQLMQVSLAYSKCILCFEGSKAFELGVVAGVEDIIVLGCRTGVAVSILTTTSAAETAVSAHLLYLSHNILGRWRMQETLLALVCYNPPKPEGLLATYAVKLPASILSKLICTTFSY